MMRSGYDWLEHTSGMFFGVGEVSPYASIGAANAAPIRRYPL